VAAVAGIAAGLIAGAVTGYTVVRSLDDSREAPAPTTATAVPPSEERSGAVPVSAPRSTTTALPTTAPPAAPSTASPSSSAPFAATPPVEVGAEEPTPISVVLDDVGHVVDDTQELVGEVVEELPRLDGLPALPGLG
jgi:hypothetical protein